MLKLAFLGAADTVTGSRTLLTYRNKKWLVDCGLFQGDKIRRDRNWAPLAVAPTDLAGVVLTHAHLDHTGYLPKLCSAGFAGPVHATSGTAALSAVLLRDAAHLEEEAALYANATGYSHHNPALPLFTKDDAELAIGRFVQHPRGQWITLQEGLSFRFVRAGHIIGASLIQFSVDTDTTPQLLTFSGDLGNYRSLFLKGPEYITTSHALVLESTYGDRLQPRSDPLLALAAVVNRTMERGGVLVIPSFAVGRAQEVTYMLRLLEERRLIPEVPVILDSPMAVEAMRISLDHPEDLAFESAFAGSGDVFRPQLFEVTRTADESMLACMRDGPFIVISASGMLNGGRILHHLKSRLGDARNTVLFTGYQAEGSKGRFLQDNAGKLETLRIHHQPVTVAAEIVTLDSLSAHADYEDTLQWLARIRQPPERIFLNHGEPATQRALAERIRERFGIEVTAVSSQGEVTLWP